MAYILALLLTVATLFLRLQVHPQVDKPTLLLFTVPILLSAWWGGLGPGLFATVVAFLAADFFLLEPVSSLRIASPPQVWQAGILLLVGLLITATCEILRRSHRQAVTTIAELKRTQCELNTQLKETSDLRAAMDEHAIVAITDPQGRITFANDKFCRVSKFPREELLGQDHRIVNSGHHAKAFMRDLWTTIKRGTPWHGEIKNRAKDGSYYWVDTTIMPFLNEQGTPRQYVAIRTDITQRKEAERRLATQNVVSRILAESVTLGEAVPKVMKAICESEDWDFGALWQVDKKAGLVRCAEVWHRTTLEAGELATRTREMAFPPGTGLPGRVWKSGKPLLIPNLTEDSECPRAPLALRIGIHSALAFPILLHGEVIGVIDFLSREIREADENLVDMFTTIGEQIGLFFERKLAELERQKLEEQLRQAQKMKAIGQLSGGIAHDFNNILTAIIGNTALLQSDLPPDHPALEFVEGIEKAGNRARELVRRILTFSRQQESLRKPTELRPVIEEAVKLLRATLPAMIRIETRFDENAPVVSADSTQVHQVIMNLGTNAAHAIGKKNGRLEIALEAVTLDEHNASLYPGLQPGRFACLSVSDDGCGMDKATRQQIFDPFFTTKPVGEGTGLGLSVVHGIIKNHHGVVDVHSEPGQGTRFHLLFPSTDATTAIAAEEATHAPEGHGEHILYVDDEEALVFLVTRMLERLGYHVAGFSNPAEALYTFRANPQAFDAAVSDCAMPGMTGFALAEQMLQMRPDLPVVLSSGYIRPEDTERARKIGVCHLILKPNTVEELGEVLHRIFSNKVRPDAQSRQPPPSGDEK